MKNALEYLPMIAAITVIIVFLLFINSRYRGFSGGTTYRKAWGKHYKLGKLLTKNEYSFYMQFRKLLPAELLIFPKVRMEDFLDVVARDNFRYRGYVRCRHVDFLICTPSLNIVCGVELDDRSHETKQAKQTDKLKNDIFKEIKVPLIRGYNNKKDINRMVNDVLKRYEKMEG